MASPPASSAIDTGRTKSKLSVEVLQDEVKAERAVKLKKYNADYAQRLMSKYFSQKGMDGEDIFDKETVIGEEIIKSGRTPGTTSFINTMETPKDENTSPYSAAETSNTPGKKATTKKETTKAGGSNKRGN